MTAEKTGNGPDPAMPSKNRGGRPRKDGTRADSSPTLAELGFSKRDLALMRRLAALTDAEFEEALAKELASKRRHSIEYFLPDRHGNSRHARETASNISRLISTLRRLAKDYEFDSSPEGELMRARIRATARVWLSEDP